MVDIEINKGINDEYLWVLHGSDVELHVGGADPGTGTTGFIMCINFLAYKTHLCPFSKSKFKLYEA